MQSLLALRIFQALGLSAITLALIVHFVRRCGSVEMFSSCISCSC
jgi:hypothetical protein